MTEPRIPPLPADKAKEAVAEAGMLEGSAELAIFQVLVRHPKLAKRFSDFLGTMLFRNVLDHRLRELAIMRIGWITGTDYEWTQHWQIAPGFGVSEDELLGVRDWQAYEGFGPLERAVLAATDETLQDGSISDATWETLAGHLGEQELIELVTAIGGWRMVASMLQSLRVPLEPGVASWPPDGTPPAGAGA